MTTPQTPKKRTSCFLKISQLLLAALLVLILAAIIIPQFIGTVSVTTQTRGINSARELFKAYQNYQLQYGAILYGPYRDKSSPAQANDHGEFARILSREGYIDSALYFYVKGDPLAPNPIPTVAAFEHDQTWTQNPDFANYPISFEILLGVSVASVKPIPILWSRGLKEDGTWPANGPYGKQGGGLVILTNGSVRYIENQIDSSFPLYRLDNEGLPSDETTTNLFQAILSGPGIGIIGRK
jgi:type II secretory pathway pseudopilin PulG